MTEAEATAALLVNGKIKPGETSASRWTGQEQLIQHGWVRTPTAGIAAPDIANVYEIRPAMDALELEDGRPVPYVKWKHQNPATVNGVDYQVCFVAILHRILSVSDLFRNLLRPEGSMYCSR